MIPLDRDVDIYALWLGFTVALAVVLVDRHERLRRLRNASPVDIGRGAWAARERIEPI